MSTTTADQLTDTINTLKESADGALAGQTVEDFVRFEKFLNEVEAFTRETQQSMWAEEAMRTIKGLESGNPLTESDKNLIRTFLVSDAEGYLAVENNYGDWLNELRRLMVDVQTRARTTDRHTIGKLRGVLKDAMRLVPDIRNYLDEKQRVEKLTTALQTLDRSSRDMLAGLLRDQLSNHKR